MKASITLVATKQNSDGRTPRITDKSVTLQKTRAIQLEGGNWKQRLKIKTQTWH
jgi:hypothetical protein